MLKARYNRSEPLFAMIVHDLFELSCEMNKSSVVEILTKDINGNPVWLSRNINDYEDYVDLLLTRLWRLLYATPTEFVQDHIPDFEKLIPRTEINCPLTIDGVQKQSLSSQLIKILRFSMIRKRIAPSLLRTLGLKSCVYCNANYAISDAWGDAYYDIDHWKPKALYPYLSISFFNFQPSCASCNRRKSNSDEVFFCLWNDQPGTDVDMLDFKLSYLSQIKYIVFGDEEALDISLIPSRPADINNVMLRNVAEAKFHLNGRYKEHNDVAEEIIWKKWIYNLSYIQSLRRALGYPLPTYVDVDRFILGTYSNPDDIHKRPLTRMIQAIAKDIGLL